MTSQTVFISYKLDELEEERKKVEDGINELWNQENMPFKVWTWDKALEIPSGKHADKIQDEGIEKCDIYVLILGSKYGNFEYGESSTHKEYKKASSNIEEDCILLYISEVEDREEKLDRWIREFKEKRKPSYKRFKNPDDLKNLVKNRLRDLWNKKKEKASKTGYTTIELLTDEMDKLVAPLYYKIKDPIIFQKGSEGYRNSTSPRVQEFFRFWEEIGLHKHHGIDYLFLAIDNYLKNKSNNVHNKTQDAPYKKAEEELFEAITKRYFELKDELSALK